MILCIYGIGLDVFICISRNQNNQRKRRSKKMAQKKKATGNGKVASIPSMPELRKFAKQLDIKSVGKTTEKLHVEILEAIKAKYVAKEIDKTHALVKHYNKFAVTKPPAGESKAAAAAKKKGAAAKTKKAAAAKKAPKKKAAKDKGATKSGPFVYATVADILKASGKKGITSEDIFKKAHKVHADKKASCLINTIRSLVSGGLKKRGFKIKFLGDGKYTILEMAK